MSGGAAPSAPPALVDTGGAKGNFLLSSLSLAPDSSKRVPFSDPFYDAYDVLDYGEMTKLGYDSLVREVMKIGVARR